jgi:integrase
MQGKKGTVSIESLSDRGLRLRWRYSDKRCCIALGIPDSPANRTIAESKAKQIELDIISGHFDDTLERYQLHPQSKERSLITAVELFKRFTAERTKNLAKRTLPKYKVLASQLETHLGNKQASEITEAIAEKFVQKVNLSPRTLKERVGILKAAWNYGIQMKLVKTNPWDTVIKQIKVSPKQMSKPFTLEEIRKILEGFRSDRYYSHYADYVEFLFGTGCRPGEAIGLCWQHISDNFSTAWIGESLSRGERKSTKTNKARTLKLSPRLQEILKSRQCEGKEPDSLVFTSKEGSAINDNNFCKRAWTTVLKNVGVPYRKPYNTRHSLISHALDQGMNPVTVAQLTGHDVEVLYRNYAGSVDSHPQLPTLDLARR